MAYVAISERLRDEVRRNINMKRSAELNLLPTPGAVIIQSDDPRIIEQFWGEHAHLRDVIPREWCAKADSLSIRTMYNKVPDDPATQDTLIFNVGIVGGTIYLPPRSDTYSPKLSVPNDAPEVAEHVRKSQEQFAIGNKWRKVHEDVMTFLQNCKSLNEALKLWPDLRIYIPQSALDKCEEKSVKAKAAESRAMEILKSIDTGHAISSAVMVRILEANKNSEAPA